MYRERNGTDSVQIIYYDRNFQGRHRMSEQIPCHELVQRSSSSPPPAIAVPSQHLQTTPKDEKIFEYSVQEKKTRSKSRVQIS